MGVKVGDQKLKPKKPNGFLENPKKPNGFSEEEKKPNGFFENPNENDNENDNDNDNENDNENESTAVAVDNTHATADKVYVYFQNNIDILTERTMQIIEPYRQKMSDELIIRAMEIAIETKNRRLNYIEGILKAWNAKGIYTLLQAQEEQEEFKKKQFKPPESDKINKFQTAEITDFSKFYCNL